VTVRVETKIKGNGSGTKSVILAFDKVMMGMIESMAEGSGEMGDIWAEAAASAEQVPGFKVEDYATEELEGIKVIASFDSLEELEALSSSEGFQGLDLVTISQNGDKNTFRATLDTSELSAAGTEMEGFEGAELEGFSMEDLDIEYNYVLDVEGEILSYSPKDIATVEGSKVTWNLAQASGPNLELTLEWTPGGGPDMMVIVLIGVIIVGLLFVVVGVVLTMRGKQEAETFSPSLPQ
jgi:hypothetical protein